MRRPLLRRPSVELLTAERWCAGTSFRSRPSKRISPSVASISFEITRKSVVLPAPFGPITATASPERTSSETSNSRLKRAVAGGDVLKRQHRRSAICASFGHGMSAGEEERR
jgi:hypothetical protein